MTDTDRALLNQLLQEMSKQNKKIDELTAKIEKLESGITEDYDQTNTTEQNQNVDVERELDKENLSRLIQDEKTVDHIVGTILPELNTQFRDYLSLDNYADRDIDKIAETRANQYANTVLSRLETNSDTVGLNALTDNEKATLREEVYTVFRDQFLEDIEMNLAEEEEIKAQDKEIFLNLINDERSVDHLVDNILPGLDAQFKDYMSLDNYIGNDIDKIAETRANQFANLALSNLEANNATLGLAPLTAEEKIKFKEKIYPTQFEKFKLNLSSQTTNEQAAVETSPVQYSPVELAQEIKPYPAYGVTDIPTVPMNNLSVEPNTLSARSMAAKGVMGKPSGEYLAPTSSKVRNDDTFKMPTQEEMNNAFKELYEKAQEKLKRQQIEHEERMLEQQRGFDVQMTQLNEKLRKLINEKEAPKTAKTGPGFWAKAVALPAKGFRKVVNYFKNKKAAQQEKLREKFDGLDERLEGLKKESLEFIPFGPMEADLATSIGKLSNQNQTVQIKLEEYLSAKKISRKEREELRESVREEFTKFKEDYSDFHRRISGQFEAKKVGEISADPTTLARKEELQEKYSENALKRDEYFEDYSNVLEEGMRPNILKVVKRHPVLTGVAIAATVGLLAVGARGCTGNTYNADVQGNNYGSEQDSPEYGPQMQSTTSGDQELEPEQEQEQSHENESMDQHQTPAAVQNLQEILSNPRVNIDTSQGIHTNFEDAANQTNAQPAFFPSGERIVDGVGMTNPETGERAFVAFEMENGQISEATMQGIDEMINQGKEIESVRTINEKGTPGPDGNQWEGHFNINAVEGVGGMSR